MPITCRWLDEDRTVIFVRLEGRIESEDILGADATVRKMLTDVTHPVDVISDYSQQVYFSPKYVETAQQLSGFERTNLRLVVFMGSEFAWALYEAYSRAYGGLAFQSAYAADWAAAWALVEQARAGKPLVVQPSPFTRWN